MSSLGNEVQHPRGEIDTPMENRSEIKEVLLYQDTVIFRWVKGMQLSVYEQTRNRQNAESLEVDNYDCDKILSASCRRTIATPVAFLSFFVK